MKKISKKTREQAAMICAIAASNDCGTYLACDWLGLPQNGDADALISKAWEVAGPAWKKWCGPNRKPRPIFGEIESLLRCGWSP